MNKSMINCNGEMMMKLPIGFRFRPTDEELVVHYLKRKALSLRLPASVIPDHPHVFLSDPWSLPGNLREKRYYFWKRKGGTCSRIMATSSGFWKAIGRGKPVISSSGKDDAVGCRKSWAFYLFNDSLPPNGYCSRTRWFMHEFQLLETQNRTGEVQEDDWVVCRIFQRKMRPKNKIHGISARKDVMSNRDECSLGIIDSPSYIDFRVDNCFELGPPQPSSPCSVSGSC